MGTGLGQCPILLGALPAHEERQAVKRPNISIIGAGMAGLNLASRLALEADVTVFEKSRDVGGRMATRRQAYGEFDHGAQYFTVRDAGFHAAIEPAIGDGAVQVWNVPLMRTDAAGNRQRLEDHTPRFVATPCMTALAKRLAGSLKVLTDQSVSVVEGRPGDWYVATPQTVHGPFDWVVSTAPAPQTLKLLPFTSTDHDALSSVHMNGCFTMMIGLPNAMPLPFSASRVEHPVISWIAANRSKPDRAPDNAVVVHASNLWSQVPLEHPLDAVQNLMMQALKGLVPEMDWEKVNGVELHRWRFANVEQPLGAPFHLRHIPQDWRLR